MEPVIGDEAAQDIMSQREALVPNAEFMSVLLEMGISKSIAEKALLKTMNSSIELAATCALELVEKGDDDDSNWEDLEDSFKMVFVVNSSLNMSIGKTAAQVAHGALALYRELIRDQDHCIKLTMWQDIGEKKVVLKGKDEQQLLELEKLANSKNVPCVTIRDAGHTEIAPDSLTVLAVFGSEQEVDLVTSNLRIL